MACCVVAGSVYLLLNRLYDEFKFDASLRTVESNLPLEDVQPYQKTHSVDLSIGGMYCVNCSRTIEDALKKIDGVQSVHILDVEGRGMVVFDPIINSNLAEDVVQRINELGYEPTILTSEIADSITQANVQTLRDMYYKSLRSGVYAAVVLALEWLIRGWKDPVKVMPFLMLIILFATVSQIQVRRFFVQSFHQLKVGRFGMPILLTVSTTAIYLTSLSTCLQYLQSFDKAHLKDIHFSSSTGLLFVIFGGKYLETLTKSSHSSNLARLSSLLPQSVVLCDGDRTVEVPASFVQPGDDLLIRPGAKIPTDGIISRNSTMIDELAITGETKAVWKKAGDRVVGGTTNLTKQIFMKATTSAENSKISQINKALRNETGTEGDHGNASAFQFVEKILSVFVPLVFLVSFSTFTYWSRYGYKVAQLRALSTITVACPCALGLSVPTVMVSAMNALSKIGIHVKRCSILKLYTMLNSSKAGNTKTLLMLDKTGTLTHRDFEVTDLVFNHEFRNVQLLWSMIYHMESIDKHPISDCIAEFAKSRNGVDLNFRSQDFKILDGVGLEAQFKFDDDEIYHVLIGNSKIAPGLKQKDIHVLVNGQPVLEFNLENASIREDASEMINFFKGFNVEPVLITGDEGSKASKIAKLLGINRTHSEVSSLDKLSILKDYKSQAYSIIMVGDGLNDSPSLKYADISICLRTGHQTAIDCSDFILMDDKLTKISKIYEVGEKVDQKVRMNLSMSVVYNVLLLVLSTGLLTYFNPFLKVDLDWSSSFMSFSSLFVVLNSTIYISS